MKKIALLLAAVMLIGALPLTSSAGSDYIIENDPILAYECSPVIDGEIDPYEGWSSPAYFNNDTVAHFWRFLALTTEAKLYFAYSKEGLYFAAKVTEHDFVIAEDQNGFEREYEGNGFIYSTDFDLYDNGNRVTSYGWNGDVMTLMVDPGRIIYHHGRYYNANTAWYDVALFKGEDGRDYTRVYRSQINEGEITDDVECAGHKEGNGWVFEIMIPWEIIANDVNMLSPRLSEDLTVEELYNGVFQIYAGAMYMDRFYDEEREVVDTWGRYVTVCERCPDGSFGWGSSGPVAKSLGLTVVLGGKAAFTDIPNDSWYTKAVQLCYYNGIMLGTGKGLFEPSKALSRAEFVTVLAAFAEVDVSPYGGSSFKDVPESEWFSKPIQWAYLNGYASGTGNDMFSPAGYVTREQLATILYSYAAKKGWSVSASADLSDYRDEASVSAWAKKAISWAIAEKIISGTSDDVLSPKTTATRAQAAVILVKFAQAYDVELFMPYYF